ncbi:MAG: PIN domain-containing protein [Planctomycetota bacterium]|nr:PIN domain-containing protein [Planctomycetota bacterium]
MRFSKGRLKKSVFIKSARKPQAFELGDEWLPGAKRRPFMGFYLKPQPLGWGVVHSLSISNCVLAELYFGACNSKRVEENLRRIDLFKKNLSVLSDSEESARLFGKIKADLRTKGTIIDDFDILIASIAIANNHILVTNNTDHFERIEGLHIQDWLKTKV